MINAVQGAATLFRAAAAIAGDYQIRDNSPFTHIAEMIEAVFASFAQHAAAEAELVVKPHPHDNGASGSIPWLRPRRAGMGLTGRVQFIDGGDLGALLAQARGCVMINSTVGLFLLAPAMPDQDPGRCGL